MMPIFMVIQTDCWSKRSDFGVCQLPAVAIGLCCSKQQQHATGF
jgi:hypothetical protein